MYLYPVPADPFDGVIVWGMTGLAYWFVLAAAVGVGLRVLSEMSRRRPPIADLASQGANHEFPEAA